MTTLIVFVMYFVKKYLYLQSCNLSVCVCVYYKILTKVTRPFCLLMSKVIIIIGADKFAAKDDEKVGYHEMLLLMTRKKQQPRRRL